MDRTFEAAEYDRMAAHVAELVSFADEREDHVMGALASELQHLMMERHSPRSGPGQVPNADHGRLPDHG